MDAPSFVSDYAKAAAALLERSAVQEPIYSRGTYQVEVIDRNTSFYPFLQIKEDGHLADAFCTCALSEKAGGCPHLAAVWLRLFNGNEDPLHVRFQKSFWSRLFQMASKRHGYDTSCLNKKENAYVCESTTKKELFLIEGMTEDGRSRLSEIISERIEETEETSIKFSNLSAEELALWREGQASHPLRFELSFWSDLAKWLMWLADSGEEPEIVFQGKEGELPREVSIRFPSVRVECYISDANWPWIIPSLATVKSNLTVVDREETLLHAIHYNAEKRALEISRKEESGQDGGYLKGVAVGEWLYVEGKGFYRQRTDPLLEKGRVEEDEIGPFLTRSAKTIEKWLDVPLQTEPLPARYWLFFDDEARLHIQLYLFDPKEMQAKDAAAFFPWIYLQGKGFFHLEELMFEEAHKIVPREEVADFINRHRHWLHQFPGFQTHFGSLEAHLTYSFTPEGDLLFGAQLDYPEHFEGALDFEEWVYMKGQGFYMKKQSRGRLPLHPGLIVPKTEMGLFLSQHKEDLEQVHGFLAQRSPIEKMGLSIRVNDEERISIEPKCEFASGVQPSEVRFYGDFAYMPREGFSELPPTSRLPERYREPLTLSETQEGSFLAYEIDPLKKYLLECDPRLIKPARLHLQIRKIIRERKKRSPGWLVDAHYVSELGHIDLFTIWEAFQKKKNYLFSDAGLLLLKEPRFNWLRQLPRGRLDRKRGVIRLNTLEWIRLSVFEEIRPPEGHDPEAIAARELLEEIKRFETHRLLDLSRLQSTLRPYQEIGVQWLWFLYCHGLSGLLCDDMGLGKTHQAMALLAAILHEDEAKENKYIVVCPTSVIYHWQDSLQRFLPNLRICTYYGLERSLEHFEEKYDLLLTSYGILRTGREDLRAYSFEIAIFDEIQIAKNAASQTHRALRSLRSRMRLGLTGTPIENRLRELKALFDLVLPNYMPPDALFREMFVNPIEKQHDPDKKALLSRFIKPFILRRKKSEVLTDLPEKIEEIAYCDLSEEQKGLYRETAMKMRDTVYRDLKDDAKPVPYVHVFSALSTLKQICDHPSLLSGNIKGWAQHASGKWDLFVELLQEALGSGQKVVVFSQYLDMLAIIEAYLKKKGIGFATIKGSTRDRREQLLRFREDPACEVFVASLLAAGVGIDLTVASIVIHYDRWWNPAKENQATDRVHRMGQNRGVQVFKLVTKHTIEEHIHALIERKKGLMEEIVGQDEADQISYLSRDELIAVFETIWRENSF